MENLEIYEDIANRTDGDIYVGVVRPSKNRQIYFYQKLYGFSGFTKYTETHIKEKEQEMNFHKVQHGKNNNDNRTKICTE
jgi:hypothetical protein